jgi:hypothetical protein
LRTSEFHDTPTGNNSHQASRLYRSQSITEQLNKTPRVTPNWGHSLSKSYGGNDWPLPASESSTASTPGSIGPPIVHTGMFAVESSNDQLWSDSTGQKKRGPKPKNEPAATVILLIKVLGLIS